MGKRTWIALSAVALAGMLAVVGASTFMGGCSMAIETAAGATVPMKCHWTFIATSFVGIIGIVTSVLALIGSSKEGRRTAAITTAVSALVVIALTSPLGIGLCGNADMHCHQTALVVWIACGISLIAAIVQIVKADPNAATLPKRGL